MGLEQNRKAFELTQPTHSRRPWLYACAVVAASAILCVTVVEIARRDFVQDMGSEVYCGPEFIGIAYERSSIELDLFLMIETRQAGRRSMQHWSLRHRGRAIGYKKASRIPGLPFEWHIFE